MAYKQYTSCVDPDHYVVDFGTHLQGYASVLLMLLTLGFGAFIIITVAGGPVAITIAIAALTGAILLLEWVFCTADLFASATTREIAPSSAWS